MKPDTDTDFESQMNPKVQALIQERDGLIADLQFRRELYRILAERCDRHTAELARMKVSRNALDDALNDLFHHYSMTDAAYELIEKVRAKHGNLSPQHPTPSNE